MKLKVLSVNARDGENVYYVDVVDQHDALIAIHATLALNAALCNQVAVFFDYGYMHGDEFEPWECPNLEGEGFANVLDWNKLSAYSLDAYYASR